MYNLTTPEIIVSIVLPLLMIGIIIYLYKDKIIKFGKYTRNNINRLPLGEDTKEEKERKNNDKKDKNIKKGVYKSRRPKLFSLF